MITLQQFITKYDGEYIGDHECGTLVRQYCIEVQNYIPPSHPSAKDYWIYGMPGYDKFIDKPQIGDIVVYDGHGPVLIDGSLAYPDGHMAVYVGNNSVFEQNADPDGSKAHTYARANTYLLGYLRKQGEEIMPGVTIVGAPASAGSASGRIDVFARGSDDGLWQKYFDKDGWSDWVKVGEGIASPPAVPSPYDKDRIDVFATGIAGDLMHFWFDSKWNGPESLGVPKGTI